MSSANNNIPFVPENTIDPAAGLNESIKVIDALIQLSVIGVNVNAPPASPAVGDRYIIGTAPTGAWAGQSGKMAQWLDSRWNFYIAYFCVSGGIIYSRSSGVWAPVSGSGEANTASNIGSGFGLFASKAGVNLQFKSLVGGSNVSITEAGDTLTISASGGGTGGDVSTVAGVSPVSGDVPAEDLKSALDVPESPSDIGAATAVQGDKADTAVQPADLAGYERGLTAGANITIDRTDPENPVISATGGGGGGGSVETVAGVSPDGSGNVPTASLATALGVDDKVDKIAGKGLSANDFTDAEQTKLAGIEVGAQVNVATNLSQGSRSGTTVTVTSSTGDDAVLSAASTTEAGVMSASDKSKLDGVADGATANANTDELSEGTTNIYFTQNRVLATLMDGFTLIAGGAVSAADSLLVAIGKLQKQISDLFTGKQDTLVSAVNLKTLNGNSLLGSGDLTVEAGDIDFVIIYPNGGSAASPANAAINSRYVASNPFPGHSVICEAQIQRNGIWGNTGWWGVAAGGSGVRASQLGDDIIIQTGLLYLDSTSSYTGSSFGLSGNYTTPSPLRVRVWKVKGETP